MGQNIKLNSAIDYMLETTTLAIYLLFITQYLRNNLNVSGRFIPFLNNPGTSPAFSGPALPANTAREKGQRQVAKEVEAKVEKQQSLQSLHSGLLGSALSDVGQNNNLALLISNRVVQSAENLTGFSETTRQLPSIYSDKKFFHRLAGIIDGDGNFDIRKDAKGSLVLKAIRIKLHNRDLKILTHIQNKLHMGRIRTTNNNPHSIYIISTKAQMSYIIKNINGLIRLKVESFQKACTLCDINWTEANYIIEQNDPYFAGLVDTDGSIVFNSTNNRIECALEFKYSTHSSKLCLDNVIPNAKPAVSYRNHQSRITKGLVHKSICFKYQNVSAMLPIYDFFMVNRLYSDFKFYRVTQIPKFIEIRQFHNSEFYSPEFKLYSQFLLD